LLVVAAVIFSQGARAQGCRGCRLLPMPVPPDARKNRVGGGCCFSCTGSTLRVADGNSSEELFRLCRLSGGPQARYISPLSLSVEDGRSRPLHTVQNVRSNSGGRVGRLCYLCVCACTLPRCAQLMIACTGAVQKVLCNRHYVSGMERVGFAQRDTAILFHFE
jgi:hypothetical protein